METLYFAVERRDLSGRPAERIQPDQTLTVDEALRAMTTTGAYAAFQEKELGRLRPGARADFVVLSADPRQARGVRLGTLQVRGVWLDGVQVEGESYGR